MSTLRCFGQPFDRRQPPVQRGEVGRCSRGLVEAVGFDLVEDFSALFVPDESLAHHLRRRPRHVAPPDQHVSAHWRA